MKSILSITLALVVVICSAPTAHGLSDLFSIRTSAPVQVAAERPLSVEAGEILELTTESVEAWLGLESGGLTGMTVVELPSKSHGELVLFGVEVDPYQYISREEMDGLCFVPNESAASASFTLQPQGADNKKTRLVIAVLESVNAPPVVEGASLSTVKNMKLSGTLQVSDPDGDTVTLQVIQAPKKGMVTLSGHQFVYEPFQDATGSDSFSVIAMDRFGNYSAEAVVKIKIENNRSGFAFADLAGNPSEYAAFKLHDKGVYSGERIGASWFFYPSKQMSRGEFVTTLLAAAGLDSALEPTVNTKLPNDSSLPLWIKPYIKRAIEENILDRDQAFFMEQIPTRAEAVLMVSAAAKIDDVKDFDLSYMPDVADIPTWSLPAYKDLAAYRMLDLHNHGKAEPNKALDRAYMADLLWQLYKHTHR